MALRVSLLLPREPLDFTPGARGEDISTRGATSQSFASPGALGLYSRGTGIKNITRGATSNVSFSPGSPWTLLPGHGEKVSQPVAQRVTFPFPREPLDFTPGARGEGFSTRGATSLSSASPGALGLYSRGTGRRFLNPWRNESLYCFPGSPWTLLPGHGEKVSQPVAQRVSLLLPREPLDFTPGARGEGFSTRGATSKVSFPPGALGLYSRGSGIKNITRGATSTV